ncbi:hypothetical protein [Hyphomonas sp.]|uniref:hypothetical protein n=1 Tax=Hyphomonas sp. TaxID=87 RepID=UPI000C8E5B56|nr:hypothetical protein [Hyphomonas sp.]MAL45815.1 hypothetical protein [Hyphomonas sp.]
MPYYKFKRNEVYNNTLKTHPSVKFVVYNGSASYNNTPNISGAFADPIRLTDGGNVSLYELNIDRVSTSTGRSIGQVDDTGLIYPFAVKNGTRIDFRTSTEAAFNSADYGQVITGSPYPYTSSIDKEFYGTTTARVGTVSSTTDGYVSHLRALKTTINHYNYINSHFAYSSSLHQRDFDTAQVGLVNIPSVFYGSEIKKGTLNLEYYFTGTLIGRAQDTNRDGVLYSTYGVSSGSAVGLALYSEGILILTGSQSLNSSNDAYLPATDNPKWIYFAQSVSGSITAPNSAYILEMSGTSHTQTITMFATAPKGDLNHSNNPTFVAHNPNDYAATSSHSYLELTTRPIKNIVSSSYPDPTGSFEKTTYISKIGIYDEDKNLIGIAKVATPVKKTVERDFTFKIKLDI